MGVTTEQLEKRDGSLGASDVPALFGADPFKNELDVWYQKTGKLDIEYREAPSDQMEIGNDFEAPLCRWARDKLEKQRGAKIRMRMNHERRNGIFLVHLDAVFLDANALVEGKTTGRPDHPDPLRRYGKTDIQEPTDAVPPAVRIQTNTQMLAGEKDVAFVPLLCGTFFCLERRLYLVRADGEMQEMIWNYCNGWWQRHIIDGEMPVPKVEEGAPAMMPSSKTIDRIIRNPDTWAQIPEDVLCRYLDAAAEGTRADKERKAATKALKVAAGDCDGVRCDDDMLLPEVTLYQTAGRTSYGTDVEKYDPVCLHCKVGMKQGDPFRVPRKRKRTD